MYEGVGMVISLKSIDLQMLCCLSCTYYLNNYDPNFERTGTRRGHRNGYKPRQLNMRVGELLSSSVIALRTKRSQYDS